MTDRQTKTLNSPGHRTACHVQLPVRRCVSFLPPGCQSNNSAAVSRQAEGVDQLDDKHMRKRSLRQTIWVPSDDTTNLTIHRGTHSDKRSFANSSTKAINQPDAERRRQKNRSPQLLSKPRCKGHSSLDRKMETKPVRKSQCSLLLDTSAESQNIFRGRKTLILFRLVL